MRISRLYDTPVGFSARAAAEIARATALSWQDNHYSEYVSAGGYEAISLLSADGDARNTVIEDCRPKPTPALEQLPAIAEFLDTLTWRVMWARLNKLAPGACFWEHRDYTELSAERKVRLHVPLCTTGDSRLIVENDAIHLAPDALWLLEPDRAVHGFSNGGSTRIHLIIDCYAGPERGDESSWTGAPNEDVVRQPRAPSGTYERLLSRAVDLFHGGQEQAAQELLLRTFVLYSQPEGFSYDLVVRLYERLRLHGKARGWATKKRRFLVQETLGNLGKT